MWKIVVNQRLFLKIFRLHYWVTSTALLAASLVSFAKQYFGDPIECIFVRIF